MNKNATPILPTVVAVGICNIAGTKEEMLKFYEEAKKKRL